MVLDLAGQLAEDMRLVPAAHSKGDWDENL